MQRLLVEDRRNAEAALSQKLASPAVAEAPGVQDLEGPERIGLSKLLVERHPLEEIAHPGFD